MTLKGSSSNGTPRLLSKAVKVIPTVKDNLWQIYWLTKPADLQLVEAEKWNSLIRQCCFSFWHGLKLLSRK